jgi:hypothetical protein
MANIWCAVTNTSITDWVGVFNTNSLPLQAQYDVIQYTPAVATNDSNNGTLANGYFGNGVNGAGWHFIDYTSSPTSIYYTYAEGGVRANINTVNAADWQVQLHQPGVQLKTNTYYEISFEARMEQEYYAYQPRNISINFSQNNGVAATYFTKTSALLPIYFTYSYIFKMTNATDVDTDLKFYLGGDTGSAYNQRDVYIRNVTLKELSTNIHPNGNLVSGAPSIDWQPGNYVHVNDATVVYTNGTLLNCNGLIIEFPLDRTANVSNLIYFNNGSAVISPIMIWTVTPSGSSNMVFSNALSAASGYGNSIALNQTNVSKIRIKFISAAYRADFGVKAVFPANNASRQIAVPSSVTYTRTSYSTIAVRWTDNATNEDVYKIYTNTAGAAMPWAGYIVLPANSTNINFTFSSTGHKYFYVEALNEMDKQSAYDPIYPYGIAVSIPSTTTLFGGIAGQSGCVNGALASAKFSSPGQMAVDANSNIYVADTSNHVIRKIDTSGQVTTFAGTAGVSGTNDGTGTSAKFKAPWGIAVDVRSNIYVTDSGNHTVRKITLAGVVTTLAGLPGTSGTNSGIGSAARFNTPLGITVSGQYDSDWFILYVADYGNNNIRKIIATNAAVTTLAGSATGASGSSDGALLSARFNGPAGVFYCWNNGVMLVTDRNNHTIRWITSSAVKTAAGYAGSSGTNDGEKDAYNNYTNTSGRLNLPMGITYDSSSQNWYIADTGNNTIRRLQYNGVWVYTLSTIAGLGGSSGSTEGFWTAARFNAPTGAMAFNNNLYVADRANHTIRKLDLK